MSYDEPVGVPLGAAMDRFLKHLKSAPVDTLTGVRAQWEEIVGPQLSAVSRPVSITDNVLFVSCDEPAWASQIRWMEQTVRTELEQRFPGVQIQGIRVGQRRQ